MVVTEEGKCIDSRCLQFVNNKIILSNYVSLLIADVQTMSAIKANNNSVMLLHRSVCIGYVPYNVPLRRNCNESDVIKCYSIY